jgi:hypothetical protein
VTWFSAIVSDEFFPRFSPVIAANPVAIEWRQPEMGNLARLARDQDMQFLTAKTS